MLLHVLWAFADDLSADGPTFSVTGVMLYWSDRAPAHVRQSPFRWREGAWEADVEVSRTWPAEPTAQGVLRLDPQVWSAWTRRSINPRREAAQQLADAMQTRGWASDFGVVTLQ